MNLSQKDDILKKIEENKLDKNDTFKFTCSMCGSCCRNRHNDPIILNGYDLFKISKFLNKSMMEVVTKHLYPTLGIQSHIPIFLVKERSDGSCSFLRKGKCIIQDQKPTICALFPLGRYIENNGTEYKYFFNEYCDHCTHDGEPITLQEWLDTFHIEDDDMNTKAWSQMTMLCGKLANMSEEIIMDKHIGTLLHLLYFNYDLNLPYKDQAEVNYQELKRYMKHV